MEAILEPEKDKPGYKSKAAQDYLSTGIDITPDEEAEILGRKKTILKSYQQVETQLRESEERIRSLGIENKSGLALMVYNLLDRFGIYPKEKLIDREIKKIERVADDLDMKVEQYSSSADEARTKSVTTGQLRYKAEVLIDRYDSMLESLNGEIANLKEDGRQLREKMRKGEAEEGDGEKLTAIRAEIKNIGYDVKSIRRDRDRAAVTVLKSKGKSDVYRKNELIREGMLKGLEAQYHRLDILRSRLEDFREISKDRSLLNAVQMMKDAEAAAQVGEKIAAGSEEQSKRAIQTLTQVAVQMPTIGVSNLDDLEDMSKQRQSEFYKMAQEAKQESEQEDLF